MKKLLIAMIIFSMTTPAFAKSIWDSDWFEPTLLCVTLGAAGGLSQEDSNDQMVYGAVGCGVGALVGYLINQRYKSKYGDQYQEEIKSLQMSIRELQVQQAQRGQSMDLEANDYLIQKEVVPGQKLQNGDVLSPTIKYRLIQPGQDVRIGD